MSFEEVLLAGLAPDGGLYVPAYLPELDAATLRDCAGLRYDELAAAIVGALRRRQFPAMPNWLR